MTLPELRRELLALRNPAKAKILQGFFKTGKGEYAEGDKFLGIVVPRQRVVARRYTDLPLADIQSLIVSEFHEERLVALLILIQKFKHADGKSRELIYKLYLKNTKYINNWDLVDLSAEHIVGAYLSDKPKDILYRLAKSEWLWDRRIAVLSTFCYIKQGKSDETLKIAEMLLHDTHDLIQKAVGWMLREVGKRCSPEKEVAFLDTYYRQMPRTMLRYAIERFPEKLRVSYLHK
jgi:3-methyladenine DNA glycosylase AlkD